MAAVFWTWCLCISSFYFASPCAGLILGLVQHLYGLDTLDTFNHCLSARLISASSSLEVKNRQQVLTRISPQRRVETSAVLSRGSQVPSTDIRRPGLAQNSENSGWKGMEQQWLLTDRFLDALEAYFIFRICCVVNDRDQEVYARRSAERYVRRYYMQRDVYV